MLDLYAAPTTNGLRVKITLEECGLEYKLHRVDMSKQEHKTEEFLKLNPLGQTPVLVVEDLDGERLIICQSMAIMFYVCEEAGKFIPKDSRKRAEFWEPVMHAATELGPGYGAIPFIVRWEKESEHAKKMFLNRIRMHMQHCDNILAKRQYFAGNEVTLADFSAFGIISRAKSTYPEMVEGFFNVNRWYQKISTRPAVQRGLNF
tara:strand:+ start:3505 stop:4116 length:612 start_codon:yes stop_codon:yes gene_type:complete